MAGAVKSPEIKKNLLYTEEIFSRMFGQIVRKINRPTMKKASINEMGVWKENRFIFGDNYIPSRFNNDKKTIKEIKDILKHKYDIELDEISVINGRTDFSCISIVKVELEDIIERYVKVGNKASNIDSLPLDEMEGLYERIFSKEKRIQNFDIADRIAAEKHMYIHGLGEEYTASQLKKWRTTNFFTWHESFYGYYLVPAVIHGNFPHMGLVGREKGIKKLHYIKNRPR